jgi:hypothetical protein
MRQRLPQFGTDCASIFASALDRGKRFALQVFVLQVVCSGYRRRSGSVSTRRRGDAPCQLFRLRRLHHRPRLRRLPQQPWSGSNPASSSRCWIVLPAPGVRRAKTSPARNRSPIEVHSSEFRHLQRGGAYGTASLSCVTQQQAAPAVDSEMPYRHQPAGAIGGDHACRLRRQ